MGFNQRLQVLDDIDSERNRQDALYGEQRHSSGEWLKILVEEVGEVAQAMQKDQGWGKETDASDEYTELIQTAAVCVARCEQIREERAKQKEMDCLG